MDESHSLANWHDLSVNSQWKLTGFVEFVFTNMWWIFIDTSLLSAFLKDAFDWGWKLQIDRYISLANILCRYFGFGRYIAPIFWVSPIYRYRPIVLASLGVDKTLLYSSCIQTTCIRKHNELGQDSYLAKTRTGAFSETSRQDETCSMHRLSHPKQKHHHQSD